MVPSDQKCGMTPTLWKTLAIFRCGTQTTCECSYARSETRSYWENTRCLRRKSGKARGQASDIGLWKGKLVKNDGS